ncbi:MAG: glycosyltransferase family 2 protein [Gammaproteobacteria bacterium]|nr:glycosyltransferase family 2 protein [Gammaproteobacteria bacterium]NVK86499.1 glycosyltransferase family 2 protein [Gammaproteobacteria bacterium]
MSLLNKTSVIIPAKNEFGGLQQLLPSIQQAYPELLEIIVVNDGSTDATQSLLKELNVREVYHQQSKGNGASIKAGARAAKGEFLVFMDADNQHKAASIGALLERLEQGFDMVVGARSAKAQASGARWFANTFYNKLSSMITKANITDLTSGLRAVKAEKFREFLPLLPNGFSYPTTITMAFLRSGYEVDFLPQEISSERIGKSHISPLKDGIRFLMIIFKIGTLYSPLKVFVPIAFFLFTVGLGYYGYTLTTMGRLTNMSVILFTSSLVVFLIGLVSEQINSLIFMLNEKRK